MSDIENARRLLNLARKDLRVLGLLTACTIHEPEIAGFHAQQAVEKSLKAWLCLSNVEYPRTHVLRYLIVLLEEEGYDVNDLWDFLELSPFAVQFRYEPYELDTPLDWEEITERVTGLINRIDALINRLKADE